MTREVLANSELFRTHGDTFRKGLGIADEIISDSTFICQTPDNEMKEMQKKMIKVITDNYKYVNAVIPYLEELRIVFKWDPDAVATFKAMVKILSFGNYPKVSTPTIPDISYLGNDD